MKSETDRTAVDAVGLCRARVERELERLRASLGRETGGSWKGRAWSLLLVATGAGVALGAAVARRRRRLAPSGD